MRHAEINVGRLAPENGDPTGSTVLLNRTSRRMIGLRAALRAVACAPRGPKWTPVDCVGL
jgi:hypothetical protein